MTLRRSYWISLAGAGQLPLWLLDARAKIKAAMSKAMYGEVSHTSPVRPHAAARHSHTQIAVSALPLKGSPVCSKFFVRDMLGRGEVTLRHTTSTMARCVCCSKAVDACGRRGDGVSCEACCACGQCHVRRARSGALAANSSSFMPCCRRLHSDVLQAFVSTAVGSERAQLLRPFGGGGKVRSVYGGFLSPRLH